jgi:hypothetical protein
MDDGQKGRRSTGHLHGSKQIRNIVEGAASSKLSTPACMPLIKTRGGSLLD